MSTPIKILLGTCLITLFGIGIFVYFKSTKQPVVLLPAHELTIQNDAVDVSVTYPIIPGEGEAIKTANTAIRKDLESEVARFEQDAKGNATLGGDLPKSVKSTVSGSASIEEQNERYVAILMGIEWYLRGAAHPSHTVRTYTYDYEKQKLASTEDFFRADSNYLALLSQFSKEDLLNQSKFGDLGFVFDEDLVDEGTAPSQENFAFILPLYDGLAIYFREYQVAPYAAGPQQVVIPYSKLQEVINPEGPLGIYLKKK